MLSHLHGELLIKHVALPRNVTRAELISKVEYHIYAALIVLVDEGRLSLGEDWRPPDEIIRFLNTMFRGVSRVDLKQQFIVSHIVPREVIDALSHQSHETANCAIEIDNHLFSHVD